MSEQSKKVRRGISNETKAVAQLKFHEKDAAQNGLFIGQLAEVTIGWSTPENGVFAGYKMPYLTFHFTSNHTDINQQRHVYQSLFPVESNVDTIPGGREEWKVNNIFNWIKHVLDVFYLKGRLFTEEEEEALALFIEDIDENGEFVSVDPQEVLNAYGNMFTNAAAILNGTIGLAEGETPKPCYKDANGRPISIWMKLLRHTRTKKGWSNVTPNGELGFSNFVGSGAIELHKPNTMPTILRLDLSKESIKPIEIKKEPTIGGQMTMMGGAIMPDAMPMDSNNPFAAAGDNMPF